MNQYDLKVDLKVNVGHWPIFHGPVTLCYILKTVWYMTIIIMDYVSYISYPCDFVLCLPLFDA